MLVTGQAQDSLVKRSRASQQGKACYPVHVVVAEVAALLRA